MNRVGKYEGDECHACGTTTKIGFNRCVRCKSLYDKRRYEFGKSIVIFVLEDKPEET